MPIRAESPQQIPCREWKNALLQGVELELSTFGERRNSTGWTLEGEATVNTLGPYIGSFLKVVANNLIRG